MNGVVGSASECVVQVRLKFASIASGFDMQLVNNEDNFSLFPVSDEYSSVATSSEISAGVPMSTQCTPTSANVGNGEKQQNS